MIETAPGPSVVLLVIQGLVCILEDGACGGRPVRKGCARAEGYLGQTVVLEGQGPVDGIHLKVYQAHIPTYAAGYWLFGFASKKYHPINDLNAENWSALNLRTRYYTPRLHVGAFALPAFLEDMLVEVEE